MGYLRAAVLGIVQALAEFLPISSSGHLILVPALFNWPDQGLAFDVGLHVGTLLALLTYFWRDWWLMATGARRDFGRYQFRFADHSERSQLLWLILAGSVPAAVAGLLFNRWIESNLRQPWLVAVALALVGVVMLIADHRSRRDRSLDSLNVVDALLIGIAQAAALFPGVSRSGATMTVGLFRDFTRESAARFAFLLGTPAFVGAALIEAPELKGLSNQETTELAIGLAASALVGFLVIHSLMRFLRTRTLFPFVFYRFGVAALTLVIGALRTW